MAVFGFNDEENGGIPVFVSLVLDVSVEVLTMTATEGVNGGADTHRLAGNVIIFVEVAGLQTPFERRIYLVGEWSVFLKERSKKSENLVLFHDDFLSVLRLHGVVVVVTVPLFGGTTLHLIG